MLALYHAPFSPPSRAVRLTAEYIGVSLKLYLINPMKGDQFGTHFEQLNPDRKIPFLVDGDFKIGESRAIMIYLVEKYARNSKILPSDPCGRALVNRALHFDIGTLYKSMAQYYFPVIFKTEETHSPERYERLKEAFGILEKMLENQDYVAGRNLTIADLSIITTVTTAEALGFDLDKFRSVAKWIDRVRVALPGYKKINVEGVELFKKLVADQTGN